LLELILSIVALVVAIVGSLPLLLAIIVYATLKPKLSMVFASKSGIYENIVPFSALKHEGAYLNLQSRMNRSVYVRIEFIINKPWQFQLTKWRRKNLVTQEGFKTVLLDEEYIDARSVIGMPFPYELPQKLEECAFFKVTVYPSIEASKLGLPHFFGRFNLRPITKSFRIVS